MRLTQVSRNSISQMTKQRVKTEVTTERFSGNELLKKSFNCKIGEKTFCWFVYFFKGALKFLHSDLLKKDEGKRSAISINVFYLLLSKLCRALVYNMDPKCIYWLSFLCKKVLQKLPAVQILKHLSCIVRQQGFWYVLNSV